LVRKQLEKELPAGYDIDTHFTPRYNPWDQRFCVVPDGDLFKAIRAGSVTIATDHIDTFTRTGLRLVSGQELEADIIVSATGLELLFAGGIELSVDGEKVDVASRLSYKGMMLEGVPNLAIAIGYTNASWTLKCDLTCDYVCRLLNRMRATGKHQATAINTDASVSAQPLLGLTSGYVRRSEDRFPKQGTRFPWQVHQSYLKDYRALKLRGVEDDALVLSSPARPPSATSASDTGAPALSGR
jgi:monooxygenase